MIIDCISDLHGDFPKLQGGDLLIVAGDLTAKDQPHEYLVFLMWLTEQNYTKKILVAGNHDNEIEKCWTKLNPNCGIEYLCDSGTEFEGLKIWGSPWTKTFPNMNPHCKAFTVDTEEELAIKFSLIPKDTAILITHSPVYGNLDKVKRYNSQGYWDPKKDNYEHVGSKSLQKHIDWDFALQLHVCGHVHEGYGEVKGQTGIFSYHYVNCSIMNEIYEPINKPIRVEL